VPVVIMMEAIQAVLFWTALDSVDFGCSLVHSEGYMFFDRQHGADSSGATPVPKHTSALLHTACFTGIFDILPPSEFTRFFMEPSMINP